MNLVQLAVNSGGKLAPLVIPHGLTSGTGLMNPSIFRDSDGDILVNLRHVNYTLYHSENNQQFPSRWGPLSYLHPEKDMNLRTTNYICLLNKDLEIVDHTLVDTSELDIPPIWEFTGQEDCRLVQWEGQYYLIGVRRDVKPNGEGRMEYSHIQLTKGEKLQAKETKRVRMPSPEADDSYCEKNWVPILDKPYHFIKWHSPVELVYSEPTTPKTDQVSKIQGIVPPRDLRGGSQLVPWGKYYISIPHEVNLFNNYLGQKDGIYMHRIAVWDKDLNLVGLSPEPFTFLDGRIEFCTGATVLGNDLLISFGFQDNAAFVLRTPESVIAGLVMEAMTYGN